MRPVLAVIVVVLGISGTACAQTLSGELDFPTDRDNFFHVVAVNFSAPELCGRINPRADGGGGAWSPAGYQITSLQSSCYRILADAMHDVALMQSLGYGDREVVESEYEENPENSATFEAYSQLRDDPAFLLRLQSAP